MKFERLGSIAKNLDNKRVPLNSVQRESKSKKELYPYIGANNIMGYIDEYIFDEKILCIAEDGGSWGAGQICTNIYNEKCWVNNHAHVLVENGKAKLEYLRFFLNQADLTKYITGSTRGKLTKSALESILVPLPSLSDQIHIANILTKAENLISQRKESIRLLDEYLKSTFLEMFGDPVRNEKGWEMVSLSRLGSLDRGVSKNRPRNAPELLGGKYPLIQTGEVSNSGLYIKTFTNTYSELGLKQSKLWKKGTLLITIAANIAQTSILTFDACFPDSIVGFKVDVKEANTIYIHFLFGFFQKILEMNAPQSAQKNINLGILRELQVPKPTLALQNQFAQIVEKTESLKTQYQQSLQELENLYGSLSQRAFSPAGGFAEAGRGELTIKDEEDLRIAAEPNAVYKKSL